MLEMLLNDGLSNCREGMLYPHERSKNKRVEQYLADVEEIVNHKIIGAEADPSFWRCPYDKNEKALAPITMDNNCARKVVDNLTLLIDKTVMDNNCKMLWLISVNNYKNAMKLLRKEEDFTDDEIAKYQKYANLFFVNWVKIHTNTGVSNYIHMMGSGHFAEYLFKWRNLYRYSQQGWEAMNALIKTFFFWHTNHGGGAGNKGTSNKS